MAVNENHDFLTDLSAFLGKMVAPIAIFVGAAMKLGVDLIKKRKLTITQRIGIYIVTVSFGLIGWWACLALGYKMDDARVPLVIVSMSYFGEQIVDWASKNRDKILNWITFRSLRDSDK